MPSHSRNPRRPAPSHPPLPGVARLRRPRTRATRRRPHLVELGRLSEPQSQGHRVRRRVRRISGRSLRHSDDVRHQRARGRPQSARRRRRRRGHRPRDHFRRDALRRRRMHGASGLRRRQRRQRMHRSRIRRAPDHAPHQGHHPGALRRVARRSRRTRAKFRARIPFRSSRTAPTSPALSSAIAASALTALSDASVFSPRSR